MRHVFLTMIKPIVTAPNEFLRLVSKPLPDGVNISKLLNPMFKDMIDTATKHDAEGLAAIQIGAAIRLIIISVTEKKPRQYVCLINPKIVRASRIIMIETESCLSIPGALLKVPRPLSCTVSYNAYPNGNFNTQVLQGRMARIVQHECEHLDGILITDKAVTIQ